MSEVLIVDSLKQDSQQILEVHVYIHSNEIGVHICLKVLPNLVFERFKCIRHFYYTANHKLCKF